MEAVGKANNQGGKRISRLEVENACFLDCCCGEQSISRDIADIGTIQANQAG
jgi:hypothetical protein